LNSGKLTKIKPEEKNNIKLLYNMTKKYLKRKSTHKKRNLGSGISHSRPRSNSYKSRVTPLLDNESKTFKKLRANSFNRSAVSPIFDDEIPIESPYKTLSPNMFRLVYEGDLAKQISDSLKDNYSDDAIEFDLPLYDSIDKPGRFGETIYQRPIKYKTPYDLEAPNPFWSNSNEDFGQFVELSKSASPNLGRGTKRKYNYNKRHYTKHRTNKKHYKKHYKTKNNRKK
jgi:hypothetical protein